MDGGAGGLGHGPLVPDLLSVVATPEADGDVVALGHGNGLLLGGSEFKTPKRQNKNTRGEAAATLEEHFLLLRLTLRGKRMGNQENIPGECVSGFMPVTDTTDVNTDF